MHVLTHLEDAGRAKVDDFEGATFNGHLTFEEDVVWLDVAMAYLLGVHEADGLKDLLLRAPKESKANPKCVFVII